ncbi:uncharacterized protein EHS24_004060 [Apiotrichum porosum]|uniref:Smr domain-containing protein n=1 Tax=Apiotrichum porosum TaxID=105984 RepID=A0A427Y455_9TREE|nr:uncharacterized protein EHS24_004060 [Apiotrichum porosum]RSH85876.1 hypothetical protein EHS24_004060 [Apiotrichum porosum]
MGWGQIILQLLQIFCGGSQNQPQNSAQNQQGQQQQHQQQQQQQGGAWNQGQQQQQGGAWQQQGGQQQGGHSYPPGSQGWNNNQQQQQQTHQQNQNQNQQQGGFNSDMANASDAQYTNWRNQARKEGDLAHQCFADSQTAYKSGDGARAHTLSVEGKQHQAKQDQIDDKAADWIFAQNNKTQPHGTIDLHGLYVREAIERVESSISEGQRSGLQELRVITGKGIHSTNHQAKIKPAVEDLMKKYNLSAELDPRNAGVLVVDLQGRGAGRSRDAGGLVDQMGGDKDCVIM